MGHSSNNLILATALGVVAGLALPPVVRRIQSSAKRNRNEDTTHAVRSGLSSDSSVRIDRAKLDNLMSRIIQHAGNCTKGKADLVANVLTYADSRGIPSHGANRCDTYVNELAAGLVDGTVDPIVESCSGACAVINGRNGLGAVTAELAMTTALKLATNYGVSVVTCHSSNHYGAAGYWAKMALDQNMIGMSFTNTSPFVVPTGGKTRALGTNPFCFFAPAGADANGGDNFQLDMATPVVPIGKVEVMNRIGQPVPLGWGVDGEGKDCTDSTVICKHGGLYPLGGGAETAGYKGYGLGMFVEILCAVLSGAAIGPDVQPWNLARDGDVNYGHCFIVIDPARFVDGFEDRLRDFLNRMRGLPGNVKVAGDPEKEFEKDAAKHGIPLHENVAATLKVLAVRYDVPVPVELERLDEKKSKASLYA